MDKENCNNCKNCKNCKKEKDRLNSLYGMTNQERERQTSYERIQIAEEHLAEVITKGVDDCPLDEYKSDMLMSALDAALDNLEIDKPVFIAAWSKPIKGNLMMEMVGDILNKISKEGITEITSLAAGLSVILEKSFDKEMIKIVIKLMNRYYNEEDN